MTLRNKARETMTEEEVANAARMSHELNYHTLHIYRNGTMRWHEAHNENDDLIDRDADHFQALPSVIRVGTGTTDCNCHYCDAAREEGQDHDEAIRFALSESDLTGLERMMLNEFDLIPIGYFDDEAAAE